MNSSAKRSRAIVASAILLSALAAVLRILCLLFFYDKSIGYYSSGAALPIFSTAFFALCSIACVILPLILFKNQTFEIMKIINQTTCSPFVKLGDVLVENISDGVNLIVSGNL